MQITRKPNYIELGFILLVGVFQPIIEILFGSKIATYYNGIAITLVLLYVIVCIIRSKGAIFSAWGMRTDTFRKCLFPHLIFALIAALFIYAYGWLKGNTPLPIGFWYVLGLYPLWGLAQQFALQNFVARNIEKVIPSLGLRSLIVAFVFACAHIPSVELVILTFGAGLAFTYLYYKYPNLFALGIAHGLLGALAFHLVLGQNQWAILVKYFS